MKSRSRLFLQVSLGCALLSSALALAEKEKPASPAAEPESPAQLKPVAVNTVFVSITLRPFYRDSSAGARLSRLMIADVRVKSLAARAGLVAGMEIIAIQGSPVFNLREAELENLCAAPVVGDALALKVADAPRASGSTVIPREIRVPLAKAPEEKPKDYSVTLDPNKRRPAGDQK